MSTAIFFINSIRCFYANIYCFHVSLITNDISQKSQKQKENNKEENINAKQIQFSFIDRMLSVFQFELLFLTTH